MRVTGKISLDLGYVDLKQGGNRTRISENTDSAPAGDIVIQMPSVTATLVGRATTDTLTNKTISGSSNTITNIPMSSAITGQVPIANGGTGASTQTTGFNALSPLTTKGDLVGHNGTNNVRFAAGTNGTVLSADSGEAAGLRWISVLSNPMDDAGQLIVGGASGAATKFAAGTADYVLTAAGAANPVWKKLVAANIDAAAAIATTQLAAVTASRALVSNASGFMTASSVTATELGYLAGVTAPTGTGAMVLANTPTLITPVIGVATATSINKVAITAPASGATITIADGKTFTASNTLTVTATDGSTAAFGAGGTVAYQGGTLAQFAATTSAELRGILSDETGGGAAVFADTPTLITPVLGVATATSINKVTITAPATSATLTLINGTTVTGPAATGTIMTLGNAETVTGVKTFADSTIKLAGSSSGAGTLVAPAAASTYIWTLPAATGTIAYLGNHLGQFAATTSAQLASILSDETGSGALVFATSPSLTTPILGVASATSINFGVTALSYYGETTQASTFTWNGSGSPGTTGSLTMRLVRVGSMVTMFLPATQANTGTSSTTFSSNTAIPAAYRPANNVQFAIGIRENGAPVPGTVGQLYMLSTGIVQISKVGGATFTNAASAGTNDNLCITWSIT